jgi:serine protease Do
MGVSIQNIDDRTAKAMKLDSRYGVLIGSVVEDGPAEKAGIQVGDVILEFDGTQVKNTSHLQILVSNSDVGKEKEVVILRGKKEKVLKVKLGELPENLSSVSTSSTSSSVVKLGLTVETVTPTLAQQYGIDRNEEGVIVTAVDRDSEAAQSLRPGDLIQRIGDREIKNVGDYNKALEESAGEYILVLVKRRDATFFVTLKIDE